MAIISILTTISATSFISARNRYILDSTLEETVSFIRESQIRSVSISQSNESGIDEIPKGWGIEFDDNEESPALKLLGITSEGEVFSEGKPYIPVPGTKITLGEEADKGNYLFFMTPFGESYITKDNCDTLWVISNKPSEEYMPDTESGCETYNSISVTFSYKGIEAKIIIDRKGGITLVYE